MQEIKAGHDKIPPELKSPDPYRAYYNPAEKPGYAGTGVWVHDRVFETFEVAFFTSFPDDPNANEGRVSHIELQNKNADIRHSDLVHRERDDKKGSSKTIHLFGIYFPN